MYLLRRTGSRASPGRGFSSLSLRGAQRYQYEQRLNHIQSQSQKAHSLFTAQVSPQSRVSMINITPRHPTLHYRRVHSGHTHHQHRISSTFLSMSSSLTCLSSLPLPSSVLSTASVPASASPSSSFHSSAPSHAAPKRVKGMHDVMPPVSQEVAYIENTFKDISGRFSFAEIRTPVVEKAAVFEKTLGDTSDVVSKELFAWEDKDKDGTRLVLRPEMTAGVMRALIQKGVKATSPPERLYYSGPMFRRERPQRGRYRQFTQIGVEVSNEASFMGDVEIIQIAAIMLKELGLLQHTCLRINSLGEKESREMYIQALTEWFGPRYQFLSPDSQARFDSGNVLRILDSKHALDRAVLANELDDAMRASLVSTIQRMMEEDQDGQSNNSVNTNTCINTNSKSRDNSNDSATSSGEASHNVEKLRDYTHGRSEAAPVRRKETKQEVRGGESKNLDYSSLLRPAHKTTSSASASAPASSSLSSSSASAPGASPKLQEKTGLNDKEKRLRWEKREMERIAEGLPAEANEYNDDKGEGNPDADADAIDARAVLEGGDRMSDPRFVKESRQGRVEGFFARILGARANSQTPELPHSSGSEEGEEEEQEQEEMVDYSAAEIADLPCPEILDYLTSEDRVRFEQVQDMLTLLKIDFTVDPFLIRGLDYYSHTVFEFIDESDGRDGSSSGQGGDDGKGKRGVRSQSAVLAGGRYDGLHAQMTGLALVNQGKGKGKGKGKGTGKNKAKKTNVVSGVGWAAGVERLALMRNELGLSIPVEALPSRVGVVAIRPNVEADLHAHPVQRQAVKLTHQLRERGFNVNFQMHGNMSKQLGAMVKDQHTVLCVVIGVEELEGGFVTLKNLITGDQHRVEPKLIAGILTRRMEQLKDKGVHINTTQNMSYLQDTPVNLSMDSTALEEASMKTIDPNWERPRPGAI